MTNAISLALWVGVIFGVFGGLAALADHIEGREQRRRRDQRRSALRAAAWKEWTR